MVEITMLLLGRRRLLMGERLARVVGKGPMFDQPVTG
jgi:hypothetical protein